MVLPGFAPLYSNVVLNHMFDLFEVERWFFMTSALALTFTFVLYVMDRQVHIHPVTSFSLPESYWQNKIVTKSQRGETITSQAFSPQPTANLDEKINAFSRISKKYINKNLK